VFFSVFLCFSLFLSGSEFWHPKNLGVPPMQHDLQGLVSFALAMTSRMASFWTNGSVWLWLAPPALA
jgi:hypothetical protein